MKRDVFISYSRRNIERVKEIKSEIDAQCGTDCWIDLQGIESGSEMFLRDIVGGIDACKVFLFMLSNESMESEYALLELNYAKEQGKRVVLVNIDDCHMTGVFLFKYSLTDTIVWNNPPQRDKLLRDVKRWVGEQAEQVSQAEQLVVEQQRKDEAERKAKAEEERKKQEEEEQKYIVVGIGKKVVDILEDVPQRATHIRIADGVEEIRTAMDFLKNKGIVSVIIPNSVKRIGTGAFYCCSGLTSINIPNSVTAIGSGAFSNCSGLTSINIPNSVKAIDDGAFSGCGGLTSINIPNSVTAINFFAFSRCSSLTSITVDPGNTRYDSRNNCNAIIETASNSLMAGCKNTDIPNSVTFIGQGAFCGCSGLTSINIPNSVISIGNNAFYGCTGLTFINIPNSVTSIGDYAFYGCTGLTSINIPNGVTSIGNYAFKGCTGLISINIPRSVKTIGESAFKDCVHLKHASINASTKYVNNLVFGRENNTFPNRIKITKR